MSDQEQSSPTPTALVAAGEVKFHEFMKQAMKYWYTCVGSAKKVDDVARIKIKKMSIEEKKKKFGVLYIDLIQSDASEEEKSKCLEDVLAEIKVIEDEIAQLEEKMSSIDAETASKIEAKAAESSTE
jgi:hypothetical protein